MSKTIGQEPHAVCICYLLEINSRETQVREARRAMGVRAHVRCDSEAMPEHLIELGAKQETATQAPPREEVRRIRKHASRKRHSLVSVATSLGFSLLSTWEGFVWKVLLV